MGPQCGQGFGLTWSPLCIFGWLPVSSRVTGDWLAKDGLRWDGLSLFHVVSHPPAGKTGLVHRETGQSAKRESELCKVY